MSIVPEPERVCSRNAGVFCGMCGVQCVVKCMAEGWWWEGNGRQEIKRLWGRQVVEAHPGIGRNHRSSR